MASRLTDDTQALLAGTLAGHLHKMWSDYQAGDGFLAITSVTVDSDEENNYLDSITVTFQSGKTLVVTVSDVTEIAEE